MKFTKLFVIVLLATFVVMGQTEANIFKKLGKKLENVGKKALAAGTRVVTAAEKVVPIINRFKALGIGNLKMNFTKLFTFVVLAALLLLGQTEAGGLKSLGKKLEGVGKRVFKAAEKALPVVAGYKAVGK
ncbi:uncharacterized protein LOC129760776 [Uranotaenia lowii]|uniref:uncharacterized protein LOC129760776 n=1 Tax=Uranotaenia lowii TaxID=190385 RepID=UPI00247941FA|nr:uncharacterized protein LOC129760776 [Uranotaenia lowii]